MRRRMLFSIVLLLLLLPTLVGCMSSAETAHAKEQTEIMINALIAADYQTAYGLLEGTCTEEDFQTFFEQASALFKHITAYTLKDVGTYVSIGTGDSYYQKTYHLMVEDEAKVQIITSFYKEDGNMRSFRLSLIEGEEETTTTGAVAM